MGELIGKAAYADMMSMLCQAHKWQLGERTLDAFYGRINGATAQEFEQAFLAALEATGRDYTPAKFVGALRQVIVQRSRAESSTVRRLNASAYEPDLDQIARLRRFITALRAGKRYPERLPEFMQVWNQPLSDADLLDAEGESVATLLKQFAGGQPSPDKCEQAFSLSENSEEDWGDVA